MPSDSPDTSQDGGLDELLANVASVFSPFDRGEAIRLNTYSLTVAELNELELGQATKLEIDLSDPGELPGNLDKAEVIALVTTFRRIGWSNEPSGLTASGTCSADTPTTRAPKRAPRWWAGSARFETAGATLRGILGLAG